MSVIPSISAIPDKRVLLPVLRWILMIALSYLLVTSSSVSRVTAALFVVVLLGSNLVLGRLPDRIFRHRLFDLVLVAVDVTLIIAVLAICKVDQDLYALFFFAVFIASLAERLELIALGAVLVSAAYLMLLPSPDLSDPFLLLRVPFLFIVALMFGYLATSARAVAARAQTVEAALGRLTEETRAPLRAIIESSEALHAGEWGTLTNVQRERVAEINTDAVKLLEILADPRFDLAAERRRG